MIIPNESTNCAIHRIGSWLYILRTAGSGGSLRHPSWWTEFSNKNRPVGFPKERIEYRTVITYLRQSRLVQLQTICMR